MARRPFINLTHDQWTALMTKTRANAESILTHIENTIGNTSNPISQGTNVYGKYMAYVLFSHAVEEYGKLLYLKNISPDANGEYVVEYDKGQDSNGYFKDHSYKFQLAEQNLGEIVKVHEGSFDSQSFTSDFDVDTITDWDSRLNIMNTDINLDKTPTNITISVDLDMLRKNVFDFKNRVLRFSIPP